MVASYFILLGRMISLSSPHKPVVEHTEVVDRNAAGEELVAEEELVEEEVVLRKGPVVGQHESSLHRKDGMEQPCVGCHLVPVVVPTRHVGFPHVQVSVAIG